VSFSEAIPASTKWPIFGRKSIPAAGASLWAQFQHGESIPDTFLDPQTRGFA